MCAGREPGGDLLVDFFEDLDKVSGKAGVLVVEEAGGNTSLADTTGTTDAVATKGK